MKRQSGITMVALIITIVIMLILVGVTINVSIDGKLFGTTKKVVSDAQKQEEIEVLKTAVYMCLNDETEIDNEALLKNKLPEEWKVEGGVPYVVTSTSGNEFFVYSDGEIEDVNKN
jgi:cell division protein FtsX